MAAPERNFENLTRFVREAFDESFVESVEITPDTIDETIPHSIIKGRHYEAVFDYKKVRPHEIMQPVKFSGEVLSAEKYRRGNETLLYASSQDKDTLSTKEIAELHEARVPAVHQDVKRRVAELHQSASPELQSRHPLDSFDFNKLEQPRTGEKKHKPAKKFYELGNPEATDEEIQKLLNEIDSITLFRRLSEAGLVTNLLSLRRSAGLSVSNMDLPLIVDSLPVPVGKLVQYRSLPQGKTHRIQLNIYASAHRERVIELLSDKEFIASTMQQNSRSSQ